jgi:protein-S-isoprenylcysteine O-methyltransferase Ste14
MVVPPVLWERLPLPAEHAVPMLAGLVLQRLTSAGRLPSAVRLASPPLVAAGMMLNTWAVTARGGFSLEQEPLTTRGPYGWSRNPMYAGWTLIHLGVGLATRSTWVLAVWPLSFALLHRWVLREEQELQAQFGAEFTAYREQVPRYARVPRRRT